MEAKTQKSYPLLGISGRMTAVLGTLVTVILGATMRGDWIMILVHISKQFESNEQKTLPTKDENKTYTETSLENVDFLTRYNMQNVHWMILMSVAVSFLSYYTLGGYLQWYYYIKRRDQAKEWKCQPDKFLTPENERHEIMLGSFNMLLGGTLSGVVATYILNGGETKLYFSALEMGWVYLLLSIPCFFLVCDALAYYLHMSFHYPYLYKKIHKMHHRYHQPTAFSATAMHPLEFLMYQVALTLPILIVPIYSGVFIGMLLYQYYYGMIDHSGINMDAFWPWQPASIFHDNHHKYFHVNFGFNTKLWDWLHDTLRKEKRVYSETIFGGRGKVEEKSE